MLGCPSVGVAGEEQGREETKRDRVYDSPGLCQRLLFRAEPGSLRSHRSGPPGRSEARREQPCGRGREQGGAGMSFTRPRPRRAQLPAARIMAATVLGQVGTAATGCAGGSGEPDGGRTSGLTTGVQSFRLAGDPRCLWFRCGTQRRMGAPWKGVPGFNGRRREQTRMGCGRYLKREVGSGERGGGL